MDATDSTAEPSPSCSSHSHQSTAESVPPTADPSPPAAPAVSASEQQPAGDPAGDESTPLPKLFSLARDWMPEMLARIISPLGLPNVAVISRFCDELLGESTDPLQQVMVQQIAAAHSNLMRLQLKLRALIEGLPGSSDESMQIHGNMAARLTAEFRRTVLALKELRDGPARPHITKITQQNVAHEQQVNLVESVSDQDAVTLVSKGEPKPKRQRANRSGNEVTHGPRFDAGPEISGANSCGTAESAAAGSAH